VADSTPGNKLTGKVIVIKFAGSAPQAQQQPQQSRPQQQASRPQQNQQGRQGPDFDSFDDDIPFAPHHHLNGA
jgi:single-strand DNA-binding protein